MTMREAIRVAVAEPSWVNVEAIEALIPATNPADLEPWEISVVLLSLRVETIGDLTQFAIAARMERATA